jgi:hypothetical protein
MDDFVPLGTIKRVACGQSSQTKKKKKQALLNMEHFLFTHII